MAEPRKNIFNPETGKAESIPESALARAEETEGARELTSKETAGVIHARENRNNLNPIEMGIAAQHGWIRGVGEAFGVPVDTAATGIAGLFGDQARAETREYLKHLEEAHPVVSGWYGMLGQTAGQLTAAELVGGSGAPSAGVVPRTLGGVASRAAGGGVENVIAATTHDVNEASLGNADSNGEKLAAAIPKHFAVGAGLTALFEGAGAGLESMARGAKGLVPSLERGASKALGREVGAEGEAAVAAGERIREASRTHAGTEIPTSGEQLTTVLEAEQAAQRAREAGGYTSAIDTLRGQHQTEAAAQAAQHEAGRVRVAREGAASVGAAERGAAEDTLTAAARGGERVEAAELEGLARRRAAHGEAFEANIRAADAEERAGGGALQDFMAGEGRSVEAVGEHYSALRQSLAEERVVAAGLVEHLAAEREANAAELAKIVQRTREAGHVPAEGRISPEEFDAMVDELAGIMSSEPTKGGRKIDPNVRWAVEMQLRDQYKDELASFATASESTQAHIDRLTALGSDLEKAHTQALEHLQTVDAAMRTTEFQATKDMNAAGRAADQRIAGFQRETSKAAREAGAAADDAMATAREVEEEVARDIEKARGIGEKEVAKATKEGERKVTAARAQAEAARGKYERVIEKERAELGKAHAAAEKKVPKPTEKTDVDELVAGAKRTREEPLISAGAGLGAVFSLAHGHPIGAGAALLSSFAAGRLRAHGNIMAARLLRGVSERISAMDRAIERGAASLFSRVGARAAAAAEREREQPRKKAATFDQVSRYVLEAKANPTLIESHVKQTLGPLAANAPSTYAATLAAAQRQQMFLEAVLPMPQRDMSSLTPHLDDPGVSDTEQDEFMRLFSVVEDPLNLFAETKAGTLSPDQVDAVKFVYGKGLYRQMADETERQIRALKKPIDYERELAIGVLLGRDANDVLEPDFQGAMAASYEDKAQAGAPIGGSKAQSSASKLTKDVQSTSERVQRGEM